MFKIILDESSGVEVHKKSGRRYTYEIPADGILRIRTFEPFRAPHEETAAYRDGTTISTMLPVSADAIALRDLGTSQRGDGPLTMVFVVGTKKQANNIAQHLESPDFDKTPPQVYNQQLRER